MIRLDHRKALMHSKEPQEGLSLLCSHNPSKGRAARALRACPKTQKLSRNRAEGLSSPMDLIQLHSCPCKQLPEKQRDNSLAEPSKQGWLTPLSKTKLEGTNFIVRKKHS